MKTPQYSVAELVNMLRSHPDIYSWDIQSTNGIREMINDFLIDCCTEDDSDPMLLSDQIFDRFWKERKGDIVNLSPPSEWGWPLADLFHEWITPKLEEYKLEY